MSDVHIVHTVHIRKCLTQHLKHVFFLFSRIFFSARMIPHRPWPSGVVSKPRDDMNMQLRRLVAQGGDVQLRWFMLFHTIFAPSPSRSKAAVDLPWVDP